jgi:hypothetical protein
VKYIECWLNSVQFCGTSPSEPPFHKIIFEYVPSCAIIKIHSVCKYHFSSFLTTKYVDFIVKCYWRSIFSFLKFLQNYTSLQFMLYTQTLSNTALGRMSIRPSADRGVYFLRYPQFSRDWLEKEKWLLRGPIRSLKLSTAAWLAHTVVRRYSNGRKAFSDWFRFIWPMPSLLSLSSSCSAW